MDESATKNVIKSLGLDGVREFIDTDRFLKSREFEVVSKFALDHLRDKGNSQYIGNILRVFAFSRQYKPVLLWFCEKAHLDYFSDGGKLRLKKTENFVAEPKSLAEYLSSHSGTEKTTLSRTQEVGKRKKKVKTVKKRTDLLDTRLVLPGSFGSGKRR
jgi:hypothetical protein